MTSPYTGKEMKLMYEPRIWKFRGEEYRYMHASYLCEDTGEKFTTCESDDAGFLQVTNQYRTKYGIPFTDEIIDVRKRYGISTTKMSAILGIGTNQWRLYENGEVPNVSNGRMIRSVMNPVVFLDLVNSAKGILTEKEYDIISQKIQKVMESSETDEFGTYERRRVFKSERGEYNGFCATSLPKLKAVILSVLKESGEVFCTKMNKLLFYIDFLSYRQRGVAISGLSYIAIDFGPVPERWDRVYSEFDGIAQIIRTFGEYEGSVLTSNETPDESTLSPEEQNIIHIVCERFKNCTSREISAISHNEPAWHKYYKTTSRIPFAEAFSLVCEF